MHEELPDIKTEDDLLLTLLEGNRLSKKYAKIINSVMLSPKKLSPETVEHILNGQRAGLDSNDIYNAIAIGKTIQADPED